MPEFGGRIYKLHLAGMDSVDDVCYVGSTTRTLAHRYTLHNCQATSPEQKKCAAAPFFEEGNEVVITLLEGGPFESKLQMEQRERWWIEQHPNATNKNLPTRGWKERWEANREHNLAKQKEWKAVNKEHLAAYAAAKKEKIKAQGKARYDAGYKEKRKAAKKVRVKCDVCQKEMAKNSLWTHRATVCLR